MSGYYNFYDRVANTELLFDFVKQSRGRNNSSTYEDDDYIRLYYEESNVFGDSFIYSKNLIDWSRDYRKLVVEFKLVADHPYDARTYGFRIGFDYNKTDQASTSYHTWVSPQFTASNEMQTYILDLTTLNLNNAYLRLGGVQNVYIYSVYLYGASSLEGDGGVYVGEGEVAEIYYGDTLGTKRVDEGWIGTILGNRRFWGIKKIYSALYPGGNVYYAQTISTNNGNRTPVTKVNNGDAVAFCVRNGQGSSSGGNWMTTVCIALTPEAALLTAPNIGAGTGAYTINGITYYIGAQGTNASWGGASTISSPIGIPIFDDWFMFAPNQPMSEATLIEILERLQICPYNWAINFSSVNMSNYALTSDTSAYFSSKCLFGKNQNNAETWYMEDGYIRKGATHTGNTSSSWYMPVNRIYKAKRLKVTTKWIQSANSGFDYWNFGVGYVDSNHVLHTHMITPTHYTNHYSDWIDVTFDFSSLKLPYIDYVVFWGCDGSPGFKPNVVIST